MRRTCAASTSTGGRSAGTSTDVPPSSWSSSSAAPTSSSTDQSSRCGSAAPASSRERSSRSRTIRSRRAVSILIVSTSAARSLVVELEGGVVEPAGGGRDRGQRRAQVVRDRAEHGRLDRVASPKRLRLERLALQQLAVDRDGEQRRQRRAGTARTTCGVGRPGRRRRQRADPPRRSTSSGNATASGSVARLVAERDPCVRDAEDAGGARGDPVELVGHRAAAEERRGDRREERRLALALLGLARAPPGARRELARDDGDDEVQDEHEPVLAVPAGGTCGVGGRKSQLKASMLATATGSA